MSTQDPWSKLADEIGNAFLESFRAEMAKEHSLQDSDLDTNVVETLAAHCHNNQWSGWIEYMFSKGSENEDGSLTIPASWYWRWKFQANTPYTELSEDMKESDREEALSILGLLNRYE